MDSLAQTIRVLLEHMQNVTYLHVASLTLWVFEHLITMDMEVAYIWKSPNWTVVKALYIFVRYGTYVDIFLNVVVQLIPSLSSRSCKSLYYVTIWSFVIGATASEFELQEVLHIRGCLVTSANIPADEVMIFFMVPAVYKTFKRGGRSTLTNMVIKDVVTLANLIMQLKLSSDYFSLFIPYGG
ncbi:hypothetical protein BDQ17DRAFT_1330376 [Cyathus striatus]|nr:hypothetical protein BDQ17DRAFT_1330376 [Cyathus striatus]